MLGDLLEHVIEEADTGAHLDPSFGIEVDARADRRFPRLPLHFRDTLTGTQGRHDSRPARVERRSRIDQEAPQTESSGKLEIGLAVADDRGLRGVQVVSCEELRQQSCTRFAAITAVALEMRTNERFVEGDSLRFEQSYHVFVAGFEMLARERPRSQAVL